MSIKSKILASGAGLTLAAGLGLGLAAGPASAITTGPQYSQFLAGHVAIGTTAISASRTNILNVPDLSAAHPAVPADELAQGTCLARTTSGGYEYCIALVWNNPTTAAWDSVGLPVTAPNECLTDQWVLEAGQGLAPGLAEPLLASQLHPVLNFGSEVCLSGGDGIAGQVFFAPKLHEVLFADGNPADNSASTVPDETIATVLHSVSGGFYAVGLGLNTTSGAVAAALPTGTVSSFQGAYLERPGSLKPVPFDSQGMFAVEGTVTGGPPSVLNPLTLSNSTSGQSWTVVAP
jgi:hypothetical protein